MTPTTARDPQRSDQTSHVEEGTAGDRRTPRRRRRVLVSLLLLLAGLVAALAWVGMDAFTARTELDAAAAEVRVLQSQVRQGDRADAKVTLTSLQAHASVARDRTHGPLWSALGAVPWLGPNVRAVQSVSEVVDGLAVDALPGLMDATELVDPTTLVLDDGRVDLESLSKAAPGVVAANDEVQSAVSTLGEIDTEELLAPVARPLDALRDQVHTVGVTTATAARAVQLLPPMLGADGPRKYLMLVQNNAEQRATGGVSTLIVLRAVDGVVKVVETRPAGGDLGSLPEPILPLTGAEQALFGRGLGTYMADVTFTPDFPRSGQLAAAIWKQQIGERPGRRALDGPRRPRGGPGGDGPGEAEDRGGAHLQERREAADEHRLPRDPRPREAGRVLRLDRGHGVRGDARGSGEPGPGGRRARAVGP